MISTQRPVQTPCQWCGAPIMQPARGRLLHYCDRSHRQRAYEARTAARRLGADIDAGIVRSEPAERIVERVVRAQHPHTAAGWQTALEELRAQLADGRIGAWDAQRLQRTVALVDQQLRAIGTSWQPQQQQSAAPHRGSAYIDERLAAAIGAQIQAAGGTLSTSLERLAVGIGLSVDELRQRVIELEHAGMIVARRHGNTVPVDELAVHARVEISAT